VAAEISPRPQSALAAAAASSRCRQQSNYFCCSPLDRASELRTNTAWLNDVSTAGNTVYILFVRLDLVAQKADLADDSLLRPWRFAYHEIRSVLESHKPTIVFLGIERSSGSDLSPKDRSLIRAWFAVNADISEEELYRLSPDAQTVSIHPRILKLARTEASVAGHARSILAWHDRYPFCPTCGAATEISNAGYKRVCTKQDCRSKTGLQHFSDYHYFTYLKFVFSVRISLWNSKDIQHVLPCDFVCAHTFDCVYSFVR